MATPRCVHQANNGLTVALKPYTEFCEYIYSTESCEHIYETTGEVGQVGWDPPFLNPLLYPTRSQFVSHPPPILLRLLC